MEGDEGLLSEKIKEKGLLRQQISRVTLTTQYFKRSPLHDQLLLSYETKGKFLYVNLRFIGLSHKGPPLTTLQNLLPSMN